SRRPVPKHSRTRTWLGYDEAEAPLEERFAMVTAVVLIKAETDKVSELAQQMAELEGVSEVFSVAGQYDLVALVRVRGTEEVSRGRLALPQVSSHRMALPRACGTARILPRDRRLETCRASTGTHSMRRPAQPGHSRDRAT